MPPPRGRTRDEPPEAGHYVEKLESAELLEVVETYTVENGREVTVYEQSNRAAVVATALTGWTVVGWATRGNSWPGV
ncbi:hypothetical protein [Natrialba sp. INN-245]|uniref:hypothetical protein n=1 Tax=Natrialba sp. INN-245 TaxID=2690967 RepID=UPI001F2268C0|nr:hypothetical protein [Natrialba sp. INN-245]